MSRYALRGTAVIIFVPTANALADPSAPAIVTELDANGTDVTGTTSAEDIQSMDGWDFSPTTINTPGLSSFITGQIPGETTLGTASITYYADDTSTTIWDIFDVAVTGELVFCLQGKVSGKKAEVWPIEVSSRGFNKTVENAASTYTVGFAAEVPEQDATLAA